MSKNTHSALEVSANGTAADADLTAREIAAGLNRDERIAVEILGCCPCLPAWSSSLAVLRLITATGVLTELGRAVAAVLAEGAVPK